MSKKPRTLFRSLDGLVLLDKPAGVSSNHALQQVRHLFRARKAGHTGSLDPLATGLLPICFGEATKIAGLLLGSRKAYLTQAVLGATTDTDDADGLILQQRPVTALNSEAIDRALVPLRGCIQQRAPIFSALKQGGEPLYARARRGEIINAPIRGVEVHALTLLGHLDGRVTLEIECGSGTYVRSLVRDLGETLGCGAHVASLRRLWVDPFVQPVMFTLDELRAIAEGGGESALDRCLLPIEAGLVRFPRIVLDAESADRFGFGQSVLCDAGNARLAIATDADGNALGLAECKQGQLNPQRLFRWAARQNPSAA